MFVFFLIIILYLKLMQIMHANASLTSAFVKCFTHKQITSDEIHIFGFMNPSEHL